MKKLIILFLTLNFAVKAQTLPQLNSSNINEVIAAMTLEEKIALVVGTGLQFGDEIDNNSPYKIPNQPVKGSLADLTKVYVIGAIGRTLEIPRLGVTTLEMCDGPAGLSFGNKATAFSIGTSLASSWDKDLVYKVGQALGQETHEYGLDMLLTPAINIHRNPLGGRNFEYYSEDPLISGKMGAAIINGIQSQGVGASLKHFAANNQETNRIEVDVKVSERALREIYLKGFEIAVQESDPWTLMASYNSINGNLATQNPDLLKKVAREDWGYQGILVSDWEAGKDPVAQMKAGLNLLMPGPYQDTVLYKAVKTGLLDERVLDENIAWILKGVLKSPKYQRYPYSNKPALTDNAEIARLSAAEGMVLLKNNESTLPLTNKKKSIALFGNGSYDTIVGGSGSGFVMNAGQTTHIFEGLQNHNYLISQFLSEAYQTYFKENTPKQNLMDVTRGRKKRPSEMPLERELIEKMADENDIAILTIYRISGETTDREVDGNFNLSETEQTNIKNVCETFHSKGKKVVVLLNIGGVVETASWKDSPDAILLVWQGGQETGNAVADVISGNINPSGKLATTFPISYSDEPSASNFPGEPSEKPKSVTYEEGIYVGYRYFQTFGVPVSYPFGYGLSYSSFDYQDFVLDTKQLDKEFTASIKVTNTGSTAGKEVVQLYIAAPQKGLEKPDFELKGFAKTKLLKPGESEVISFKIDNESLASFDSEQSAWTVEKGKYKLLVGKSSKDIQLEKSIKVKSQLTVNTVNKALAPNQEIKELSRRDGQFK